MMSYFRFMAIAAALVFAACSDSANAMADRGLELARTGSLVQAISLFESALEKDANHAKARYNLGIALIESGNPVAASDQFRAFVERRPEDAVGHFSLARAELMAGRREAALQALWDSVLFGFSDSSALAAAGFDSMANDVRYIQLEVVVAQRDDQPAQLDPSVDFPGRTGDGYGSDRLGQPVPLPGTKINAPNCPEGIGGIACFQP